MNMHRMIELTMKSIYFSIHLKITKKSFRFRGKTEDKKAAKQPENEKLLLQNEKTAYS